MPKYLLSIVGIFLFASCQKVHLETIPAKIRYTGIEIGALERYVVTDPSNLGYQKISDNPSLSSKVKHAYDSIFELERIDTIEFKDSYHSKYSIYSKGIIIDTIDGRYNRGTNSNFLNLYGYINLIYNSLTLLSNDTYIFSYFMSFDIRQSKYPAIENIKSKENFSLHAPEGVIQNQIKTANLQVNDTVYYNNIFLVYRSN